MSSLKPVRGTHDLLPKDFQKHILIVEAARRWSMLYGFQEMATPILEFKDVFKRTLGDVSDIVTKEMYEIADRGGEELVLRPEGTAGVARAVISNGLTQSLPLKFFYQGPMFRYERPQKGRLRQLHQIGVELFGIPEPEGDVEIIMLASRTLESLGLNKKVTLEINTLGDEESRLLYRQKLVEFLKDHRQSLSKESQIRLERNPLRILDSKNPGDKEILKTAPLLSEFLNLASQEIYEKVCEGLKALGISYSVNPHLVRGLDYYCHVAFEFTTPFLGAQSAVIAGGRYDGLIQTMGGPQISGVGWAGGIDRLAMLLEASPTPNRPVVMVAVEEEVTWPLFQLAEKLRESGILTEMTYSGNLSKRLKKAVKMKAQFVVILGLEELNKNTVTLKDLDKGQQSEVSQDSLIGLLKEKNGSKC